MRTAQSGTRALLCLLCCAQLLGRLQAAEVLSEDDAHWLALLQPAGRGDPPWMDAHDVLAAEVEQARENGGLDYIVYGDSIMEAFRGTSVGTEELVWGTNKQAWEQATDGKRAGVFAISGDQGVHLLWRLRQGEGPAGLNPKVVTIMIGTNDAAHLHSVYPGNASLAGHVITLTVQQCVREVQRQAPQATIVVFGLLPLQPMWLNTPQREYDGVIAAANAEIGQWVGKQQQPGKLKFKDCGPAFLKADGAVDALLIPDGVHPSGPGGEVLLRCMRAEMGL